ncbi:hypothetical protein AAZX31_14G191500 [Glycine max]|uniref:Uncharacterized protein n=2 Tax=Glycine subgen. Soja TaxID=1462606 RepID=A0A0R0GML7_SOYBN|nr:hypothetical protein GYH30_040683 [Glycine max]KRH17218.1 hypothetical protein GLYMA_14G206400v4 [Glycine max]
MNPQFNFSAIYLERRRSGITGLTPVTVSNESKKQNNNAFGKTKVVASTGVKKLKEGNSVGLHWIKTNVRDRRISSRLHGVKGKVHNRFMVIGCGYKKLKITRATDREKEDTYTMKKQL